MAPRTILVDRAAYEALKVQVHDLEEEVRQLKRRLAAKSGLPDTGKPIKETGAFDHLPRIDREWLERKTRGKAAK